MVVSNRVNADQEIKRSDFNTLQSDRDNMLASITGSMTASATVATVTTGKTENIKSEIDEPAHQENCWK